MEGESTVTDAAIVDHTLGAPILEFNRQCGISCEGGTLVYASCFPSCLDQGDPGMGLFKWEAVQRPRAYG